VNLAACERLAQVMRLPSPVEPLSDERLRACGVELWLKRDDLIHPDVPGNKWRKLKHNLMEAARTSQGTLLTFGGAYSNHIRATAATGKYCGFSTIGIIRGEEHVPLNPSLAYAVSQGMRLSYLSRDEYRRKTSTEIIDNLRQEFGPFYLLPEGGSNDLAVRGCAEIPAEIDIDYDVICCPCGTGTTLAGIAAGLSAGRRAIGFSTLKGGDFLTRDVADLQQSAYGNCPANWHMECGFHFGGFARRNAELDKFINEFATRHGIALDWVYVAKMMYGLYSLARSRAITPGSRVIAVITGPPS
jgi:1-aminocyclopropane-1-carboxylate deaminase/D-cysteine desulfhydrase-like pyridoxal-dependent ACC family enzyme